MNSQSPEPTRSKTSPLHGHPTHARIPNLPLRPAKDVRLARAVSFFVAVLAAGALVATKTWPSVDSFRLGAPAFEVQDTDAVPGSQLGPVRLGNGRYYVIDLRSNATTPFRIFFTYKDKGTSKKLIVDPRLVGETRQYKSVIRADRDDPAAQVTTAPEGGPPFEDIHFQQVSVSQMDPVVYVWRELIRVAAIVALSAACLYLVWSSFQRRAASPAIAGRTPASPQAVGFWKVRRLGCWALFLLLIGGCFDAFFIQDEDSRLFETPFQSVITGWDGSYYYFWLRSVMVDGDIDFSNDLLYCNTMPPDYRVWIVEHTPRTKTGLIPNKYPIGWALLAVPWYLAGDLTAQLINWFHGHVAYDGFGPVYQVFLAFGQLVYASVSLYFSYRIVAEYMTPAAAACGLVLGWLGAPQFFYQTTDLFMSHNVIYFAMTAAYFFTQRLRERPERLGTWFLVGFFSAFVILGRYQGGIMLLFPGIVCLQEAGKNFRRLPGLLVAIVGGALPLLVQMIAWKFMYGSYFLYTYTNETFSWFHPHIYEVLFSPFHGLFSWNPMMLVGFLGFLAWAARSRRYTEAICFTLSLLLAIYINGAWDVWWFGAAFGSRAFECCTLFSMLGIGFLLSSLSRKTVAFHATAFALLILAVWNMNLMWMSKSGNLPFEVPVTWKQRIDMSVTYWSQVL